MSYFNLFKSKINYFFWNLSHTIINYLFGIFIKRERQINKNCYLLVNKKNGKLLVNINSVNYKNKYIENLVVENINFKLNNSLMPNLRIDNLFIEPIVGNLFSNKKKFNFDIWKNSSSRLIKDINRINDVCKHLSSFINTKIKNLELKIGRLTLKLFNLVIIKNNNKLILKCKKVNIYHLNSHVAKIKQLKLNIYNLKYISSIYIKECTLTIREKNIRSNLFEDIINIFLKFPQGDSNIYPKIFIKKARFNIEIHNYMRFIFENIILEKEILEINSVNLKIFKKEILWLSNFKYNLFKKIPSAENVRIRLFRSTGDKIYKSLIFLRKRYVHFDTIRKKILVSTKNKLLKIDNNYLYNLKNNSKDRNKVVSDNLISIKESYLNNYILDIDTFNFNIRQFEISFEKQQGKFLIKNFYFKSSDKITTVTCKKWLFFKNNIKYIDKIGSDGEFRIKFGNGIFEIIPYKCFINLDLKQYKITFSILIHNISKIVSIFSPNITTTKNYIFERFRIDSFYCVLSYTKNSFSIGNLFDGNYSEMLNIISLEGVELLLPELLILYPKNWSEIAKKIINKYFLFMSGKNFKNIIKKTPAAPFLKISKIKSSIGYLSNKIYNSMK